MKTVVRLGLAACLALLAMPGRAEDKVDTSQIFVKKAIADTMTAEQLQAYKERMARNLARRRAARAAVVPNIPADTCPLATLEGGALPFGPVAGTTVGDTDDYDLPADTTAPTCTASTNCVGGASLEPAAPGERSTSEPASGPDRAYHIKTDANCTLTITMDPTGAEDMGLIVYQTTCSNLLADCVCVDDTGIGGVAEVVTLDAVAGTDYFVVVDGYSSGARAPGTLRPVHAGHHRHRLQSRRRRSVGIYHTIAPCRLADTRNATGPYGGPALDAGVDRTFDVDGGGCLVPATATAVALNVTVTDATVGGNVRLWPAGTAFPTVSALNYAATQPRANNGIFALNANGEISIRATQASGTAQVIIDVVGYFEE